MDYTTSEPGGTVPDVGSMDNRVVGTVWDANGFASGVYVVVPRTEANREIATVAVTQ